MKYDRYNSLLGIIAFICANVFGLFGFLSPPLGQISNGVLWFIAQLLLFAASCLNLRSFIYGNNKNDNYITNENKI